MNSFACYAVKSNCAVLTLCIKYVILFGTGQKFSEMNKMNQIILLLLLLFLHLLLVAKKQHEQVREYE